MFFRFLSTLICILSLVGCAHYSYNNINYQTKEEAFAAQSQNQQEIQNQILPTKNKYDGNTLFVIPNLSTVKATAITKRGNPSEGSIDYIAQVTMLSFKNMGTCLEKRRIFNKVDIQ